MCAASPSTPGLSLDSARLSASRLPWKQWALLRSSASLRVPETSSTLREPFRSALQDAGPCCFGVPGDNLVGAPPRDHQAILSQYNADFVVLKATEIEWNPALQGRTLPCLFSTDRALSAEAASDTYVTPSTCTQESSNWTLLDGAPAEVWGTMIRSNSFTSTAFSACGRLLLVAAACMGRSYAHRS